MEWSGTRRFQRSPVQQSRSLMEASAGGAGHARAAGPPPKWQCYIALR